MKKQRGMPMMDSASASHVNDPHAAHGEEGKGKVISLACMIGLQQAWADVHVCVFVYW